MLSTLSPSRRGTLTIENLSIYKRLKQIELLYLNSCMRHIIYDEFECQLSRSVLFPFFVSRILFTCCCCFFFAYIVTPNANSYFICGIFLLRPSKWNNNYFLDYFKQRKIISEMKDIDMIYLELHSIICSAIVFDKTVRYKLLKGLKFVP